MGTRIRFERVLAVMGAAALIVFATDALTYAATGSSLILGRSNSAGASTTITNTGAGPALKLITKSTASAPFTVNGKGKVVNLYADRANTANLATKATNATNAVNATNAINANKATNAVNATNADNATNALNAVNATNATNADSAMNAANAQNAATLQGSSLAEVQNASAPRVSNVVWVAQSGGQYTSVAAALAAITDNGATHRYLVSVAPGTYTEPGGIELKPYVDIVGAGRDLTTITCACTGASIGDNAGSVVYGSGDLNMTVSDLTVENTGSLIQTGIGLSGAGANVRLERLAIRVGATDGSTVTAGIVNSSTSSTIDDVQIVARGSGPIGVDNQGSNPEMNRLDIDVLAIGADGFGIRNSTSSPQINDLFITAAGDSFVTGIRSVGFSAPKITDFRIEITSATVATGIDSRGGAPVISRGSIDMSNPGGAGVAIYALDGFQIIDGVRVDIVSSAPAVGVRAEQSGILNLTIRNSTIVSTASALTLTSTPTVVVTSSTLDGTLNGVGATCTFVTDAAGGAVSCPA